MTAAHTLLAQALAAYDAADASWKPAEWFESVRECLAQPLPSPAFCDAVDAELADTAEADALDQLGEEVARLQDALAFWLPDVPAADHSMHARIASDAFLLCGVDGNNNEPSAYAQGLICFGFDADAADLFWEVDDGENSSDSIEELIYERDIGEVLSIGRAMQLSSIRIRVTADPEDADNRTYEIVSDTTTPAALPAFTQELAAFGALLDGDSLEQGDVL